MNALHASARTMYRSFATAVVLALVMMCTMSLSASAQQCEPGQCTGIRIWNCTDTNYQVSFLLCCNGETVQTGYVNLPPANCPNGNPSFANFFPEGCTLIGIAGFNPALDSDHEFLFNPDTCRGIIREKP